MSSQPTVFAPGVKPPDFRDYMFLYTAGEEVAAVVDGAPVGPDGRLFKIPTGKAVRVPWEAGRFILDHMGYTGVVRVNEKDREDGSGTDLDLKTARMESLAKFEGADQERWRNYVQYVIDDKINNKRVIPPPPDGIKRIMQRRGYRLEDFGINVPGTQTTAPATSSPADIEAIKEQNRLLKESNDALTLRLSTFEKLLKEAVGDDVDLNEIDADTEGDKGGKKGKKGQGQN